MKRRILAWALALAMLLSLLPAVTLPALAAEGLPDLANVKISADGLITWDPYPGATAYYYYASDPIWYNGWTEDDKPELDFGAILKDAYAPTGNYWVSIYAHDSSNDEIACSYVSYSYTGIDQHPAPSNPRWDGYTARWDPVEGADRGYYINIYETDTDISVYSNTVSGTAYYAGWTMNDRNKEYKFRVKACGSPSGAESDYAECQIPKAGRYIKGDFTIMQSGDTLSWPPYIDTEGQEAWSYELSEYDNPVYLDDNIYGTSVNLRRLLELKNAPSGTYTYSLTAKNSEGSEVSKESNVVTYEYTARERTSVVMNGYDSTHSWLPALCLYGMDIYSYGSYNCTVGAVISVLAVAPEHYTIKSLKVCYGGEEYDGGEMKRQHNGTYYGSFTVPDQDFTLKVVMDYDYVNLDSVSVTFSEAPGQNTDKIKFEGDENCDVYRSMYCNSSDRAGYSTYMLPGEQIRVTLRLSPKYAWQRMSMDTRVRVNGRDVETLYVSDDGGLLYCAYDFTVPDGPFTIEQPSGWDPLPNLKMSNAGVATWDAFPGAERYYHSGNAYVPGESTKELSYDLGKTLREQHAPSGWYTLYLQADSEDGYVLGESYIVWYYSGEEALAVPENLRWDGYTARWDPVEGAERYLVRFSRYPDGSGDTEVTAESNFFDFSTYAEEKQHTYAFRVMAVAGEGKADSLFSSMSGTKQGRFERGNLNVTLDGDILRWEEYIDTEGNPAGYYYLQTNDGPSYVSGDFTGTSVNLRDVMELKGTEEGEYKIYMTAYSEDGIQIAYQDEAVSYSYTAETRTTAVLKNWTCSQGYLSRVRINGIPVQNYGDLPMTAGKTYTLTMPPMDHIVIGNAALRYGGGDHYVDVTDFKRLPDGSSTCSIRVPDQDFEIIFESDWDWEEVESVGFSFSEAPGTNASDLNATDPENEFWIDTKDRLCPDSGSVYGNEYLLPGQRWQMVFKLTPGKSYKRFSENPTVTVNGRKAEVIRMSENRRELYVRYDFEVAPASSVTTEPFSTTYPVLENMKISGNGVVIWDAVPGADHYYVFYDDRYDGGDFVECSFDLRKALENRNAPAGWYDVIVEAEDADRNTLAYGTLAWYYSDGAEILDTPENVRWDGYTARWDPVEGASSYFLQVLSLGETYSVHQTYTNDTSYDLSYCALYKDNAYAFRVYAYASGNANSRWSDLSETRSGRFRPGKFDVTLAGDVLSWPEYVDTEGNPAAFYYIDQYENPVSFGTDYYGTSVNLHNALEMVDAPDGDYTFCVHACEKYGYTVSEYSKTVTYHYTAQARSAVHAKVTMTGDGDLLLDRIHHDYGKEYTLTVGSKIAMEIRPSERYRATSAYLVFGEDDRQEIPLTEGKERACLASFTVPDRDFTLEVNTERFYEQLHTVSADFSEEPGYLLALIDITPEGTKDWEARISGLTGPHGAGNANLRPGGAYEAVIDFNTYSDDYRFADDIIAKINGSSCTPEEVTPTHVRVRYAFTVSSELSSITVRNVAAPVLEAVPAADQGVPGGVYYSIVNEASVSKRWYYNEDGWKWMTDGEAFRSGISYILQLEYTAEEGCTWADDVTAKVDEVDPDRIESITVLKSGEPEGSHRTVEVKFKPLKAPEAVTAAGCTITAPVAGEHPDMKPVVLDAEKYTVTLTGWYWNMQPGVKMTSTSSFASGGTYCLRVWFQPKEGYFFTEDTVFTVNGTPFDSRYAADYGQVQIDLVAKDPAPDGPERFLFDDVKDSSKFYYEPVYWAYEAKPQVTNGVDKTHFGPDKGCTRAQVVTFLWRAAGCPEPVNTDTGFKDLKKGAFYEKAVAWAVENEITNGLSADKFGPDAKCNRGQIVTFLWRFKGKPEPANAETGFTDLKPGGFYLKAVAWAVENNVTKGMTATTFAPDATCTRGQVVTFLYRATSGA